MSNYLYEPELLRERILAFSAAAKRVKRLHNPGYHASPQYNDAINDAVVSLRKLAAESRKLLRENEKQRKDALRASAAKAEAFGFGR